MRKPALVAIAVLVLVGAGGLWWWLHRSHDAEVTASSHAAQPTETARGARADRGNDSSPDQMQILVDDDPRGALRLEGQVVDAEDHPVGGATVVLASHPPRTATTEADGGFA